MPLMACKRLLVLCGAGTSADSGIPTFRDEGGLWRIHQPEDLAHPDGFARDPALVWEWYRERRAQVIAAEPHAGLRALALLQRMFHAGTVLVATTNEDDLLERAGVDRVVHLHGSLFITSCAAACGWSVEDRDNAYASAPCPRCRAPVRPGSVWFGEALAPGTLEAVTAFAADGCLVIGSSCLVAPASQMPVELLRQGHPVVEINLRETPLTPLATASLRGSARAVLPRLADLLSSHTIRDQAMRHSG